MLCYNQVMLKNRGFISLAVFAVVMFVVAVGGSFGAYYFNNLKTEKVTEEQVRVTPKQHSKTEADTTTTATTTTTTAKTATTTKKEISIQNPTNLLKDCVGDIHCLVLSAESGCNKAKAEMVLSLPHPFIAFVDPKLATVTTKTYFEIKGKEGANCIVYEKLLSGSASYNEARLKEVIAGEIGGKSPEEMRNELISIIDETNSGYKIFVGKDATCVVTAAEFKTKIDDLIKGVFSLNVSADTGTGKAENLDPYAKKCKGELYQAK